MFRKNTQQDENHYVDLIVSQSGYTRKEIIDAAKTKARAYNESMLYILRVWESKAYGGNFNLDRERY